METKTRPRTRQSYIQSNNNNYQETENSPPQTKPENETLKKNTPKTKTKTTPKVTPKTIPKTTPKTTPRSTKKTESFNETNNIKNIKSPDLNESNQTPKRKRGRPPKNISSTPAKSPKISDFFTPKSKNSSSPEITTTPEVLTRSGRRTKSVTKSKDAYIFDDSYITSDQNGSESDEFRPEKAGIDGEISSEISILSAVSSENSVSLKTESDVSIAEISASRRTSRKTSSVKSNKSKNSTSVIEAEGNLLDKFDTNLVFEKWVYELDPEYKTFYKPILPALSDDALIPYLSKKSSKKSKSTIYNCPFCQRVFTYTLVFKNHLYSCEKNTNVPNYYCYCKFPGCPFQGNKRQEMVNHFFKLHENEKDSSRGNDTLESKKNSNENSLNTSDDFYPKMTQTKQNQLEVSRYFYIDKSEFKFTLDYFNKTIMKNYKRLKYLTDFYLKNMNGSYFDQYFVNIRGNNTTENEYSLKINDQMNLMFQLPNEGKNTTENVNLIHNLQPFQVYTADINNSQTQSYMIINLINQISTMDWCPTKLSNEDSPQQYLALSTCPNDQINSFFSSSISETKSFLKNYIKDMVEAANLLYIFKFKNLEKPEEDEIDLFGILKNTIGHINGMKWRPDCGASISNNFSKESNSFDSNFIGYLLTASSNGNGYINCVQDMTMESSFKKNKTIKKNNNGTCTSFDKLNIFECHKEILLKTDCIYGQCTSCDWSQTKGATEIALGYANGTIALFQVNSNILKDQFQFNGGNLDSKSLIISPVRTFQGHQSFIRNLKWSKIADHVLASGSTISRDIKCWDTSNTYKPFIEYEIFVSEFAFTLHSNDLFIVKEANLKGENHLFELDLSYNVFNKERDETRSHSSLFYTLGTMNSIDQNDYFNKFIICDSQGSVIISSANNPKYWIAKHQLMFNSFSQLCRFDLLNIAGRSDQEEEKDYNIDLTDKSTKIIKIDLERKLNNKKGTKQRNVQENVPISNHVDLNNLTCIRWNTNYNAIKWYAIGSQSGFVFLHKIDELVIKTED